MTTRRALFFLWLPASIVWGSACGWYYRLPSCQFAPPAEGTPGWVCISRADVHGWLTVATLEQVAAVTLGVPVVALIVLLAVRWIVYRRAPSHGVAD